MGSRSSSNPLPPAAPGPELDKPWRQVKWSGKDEILRDLGNIKPHLQPLRILLYGPIGAGKSCFINSLQRALIGRNVISALESSAVSATVSFTVSLKTHKMQKNEDEYYPFVFCDIMGLEPDSAGIQAEDINKVLEGHILDGYEFNPRVPITKRNSKYTQSLDPCDKIHCLVCIVPADAISRMDHSVIEKMKTIRKKASELNIPQVIVLTKVDITCEVVHRDLAKLYHSRRIKEKVQESSNKLGISMNNIYPVKNYHAEITEDAGLDVVILMALRDIVSFASDYVSSKLLEPVPVLQFFSVNLDYGRKLVHLNETELKVPWRPVNWSEKEKILENLGNLNSPLEPLRILLYGPAGAGKSCFINSVQRALLGRNVMLALESTAATRVSFTLSLKTHKMKKREGGCYPFGFCDIMGLETNSGGIQTEDIIKVLQGHILDDYEFDPQKPITEDNTKYKQCPKTCDKIHCLVTIVPADAISKMDSSVIQKMKTVQKKASELSIPQAIVLTKVDKACEVVSGDLKKLYISRKIRENVEQTSQTLDISLSNIYPVKSYHEEITEDPNIDVSILMALRDIVNFANDYAEKLCEDE